MSRNVTGWAWTRQREQAALAIAEDSETDDVIAAGLGVTRRTLARWKGEPAFQARVAEHQAGWQQELRDLGLADRRNRLGHLNDLAGRLGNLIEERANDPALANVPGGKTGLIVAEPVVVRVFEVDGEQDDGPLTPAKQRVVLYRYTVDIATLRELANLAKQAAQDVGQW